MHSSWVEEDSVEEGWTVSWVKMGLVEEDLVEGKLEFEM